MKQCTICHEWKDESAFYVVSTAKHDYVEKRCKKCKQKRTNRPSRTGVKCCRSCHEIKPLSEFHVSENKGQGRKTRCRTCIGKAEKRATDPMVNYSSLLQSWLLRKHIISRVAD